MNGIRGDKYTSTLAVGQRVHCILYGGMDGIIIAIHGEQQPESIRHLGGGVMSMGGRATLDIAFTNHISRGTPESIVRGVQWYISDTIELPEAIKQAIDTAQAAVAEKKRLQAEKESRQANERAAMPARYPYLTPGRENGTKNIKTELKRAFPKTKFSVTKRSYSSININWTDGPTVEQVKKITDKYQKGNFDGMEDIYRYNHNNIWPDVFGGAQYVFENRHESPELILKAAESLNYNLPSGQWNNYGHLPGLDWNESQRIYKQARTMAA